MKFNYSLAQWASTRRPFIYTVIGTSIMVAIAINTVTGLLFLRKEDVGVFNIVFLVIGSLMLLISGYEFINLGWYLSGFIQRIFRDTADIAEKDLEHSEVANFFVTLYEEQGTVSDRETRYVTSAFSKAFNKNVSRVGAKVQNMFLTAIFSLLFGVILIIIGSPFFS